MRRFVRLIAAIAFAFLPVAAFGAASPQTHTTVPSSNATFTTDLQNFLRVEDALRFVDHFTPFVVSGGLGVTAAGLTHTPSALTAYPGGYYTTETGAITYPNNATCWVVATYTIDSALVGSWSRVAGTKYATECVSPAEPTIPANSVMLMKVTTAGGAITAVVDLRNLTPIGRVPLETFTVARLPSPCVDGQIARVMDDIRGLWRCSSTRWASITGYANVLDFGAVGNGTDDDSAAFNLAWAAAGAGRKVIVPYTTLGYKITTGIIITSGAVIEGVPGEGTDAPTLVTSAAIDIVTINTSGNDYTVRLTGLNFSGGTNGIHVLATSGYLSRHSDLCSGNYFNVQTFSGIKLEAMMLGAKQGLCFFNGNTTTTQFGIWAEGDDILGNTSFNIWATGTITAAIHLRETTVGGVWNNTKFSGVVEANKGKGFDLYSVYADLDNVHFENNGSDGANVPDIFMDGDGTGSCVVRMFGGYFSTSPAAQGGYRIKWGTHAGMHLQLFGTKLTGTNYVDAATIVSASDILFSGVQGTLQVLNFVGGNFHWPDAAVYRGAYYQVFEIDLVATAGNQTQHRIRDPGSVALPLTLSRVVGASTALANTPLVAAGVDFTNGVGINAAAHSDLIVAAYPQVAADTLFVATLIYNDTGTAVLVRAAWESLNVNGNTQNFLLLSFTNATTGAAIDLASLGANKGISVVVTGYMR